MKTFRAIKSWLICFWNGCAVHDAPNKRAAVNYLASIGRRQARVCAYCAVEAIIQSIESWQGL